MSRISRNTRVVSLVWMLLTTLGVATAQSADPAPGAQIVQIQFGRSVAWSTDPNESVTTVRPKSVTMSSRSLLPGRHPAKSKYALSSKDWEQLQAIIDSRVLAALTGAIGCPGCADRPIEWVAVEFGDGTKKGVVYNDGDRPPELAALIAKIQSISGFGPAIPTGKLPRVQPQLVQPQKPSDLRSLVKISGLRPKYPRDVIVDFSIQNTRPPKNSLSIWLLNFAAPMDGGRVGRLFHI